MQVPVWTDEPLLYIFILAEPPDKKNWRTKHADVRPENPAIHNSVYPSLVHGAVTKISFSDSTLYSALTIAAKRLPFVNFVDSSLFYGAVGESTEVPDKFKYFMLSIEFMSPSAFTYTLGGFPLHI